MQSNEFSLIMEQLGFSPIWPDEEMNRNIPTEIIRLESLVQHQLPEEYKEFLLQWGVTSSSAVVPVLEKCHAAGEEGYLPVEICFGFSDHGYDLFDELDTQGKLPELIIPIGQDPGGNLICLSVGPGDYGHVYYWDRHHRLPGEVANWEADLLNVRVNTKGMEADAILRNWEELVLGTGITGKSLYFIAHSFRDFIASLRPMPD